MKDSNFVREKFLGYFDKNLHKIYPPASLLQSEKSGTLFTIAGMQQFVDVFLCQRILSHKRIATIQPCLRFNDLDNIGKTKRHHTFFEMLGSFSFGDYFKKEAIPFTFGFIADVMEIDKKYLYATVYGEDNESYEIWKNFLPESKILRVFSDDNFWRLGEFGPCGPCTEIYFDCEKKESNLDEFRESIESGSDRFLEIWNSVFMQYNNTPNGRFLLEKPCVDTGAGLERISAIINGVYDNFETPIFKDIVSEISKVQKDLSKSRMVADHMRSICFLIKEGLNPGNEGAAYALRRLIRRSFVNYENLENIVLIVTKTLSFYDLDKYNEKIIDVIKEETEDFKKTLENAKKIMESLDKIDEEAIFKLYWHLVETLKEEHIEKSRKKINVLWDKPTKKLCYVQTENISRIEFLQSQDHNILIICEESSFYPEGGGQAGDIGTFTTSTGEGVIENSIKQKVGNDDIVVHIGKVLNGEISVGQEIYLYVDKNRRLANTRAHSATHLLNDFLEKKFGCTQEGSFLEDDYLRLDLFTNCSFKDFIDEINEEINKRIYMSIDSNVKILSVDDPEITHIAEKYEKYGDKIRIVEFPDISKAPCGGTHVENTIKIGAFYAFKESSKKKNVRRIEAYTGIRAIEFLLANKRNNEIKKREKIQENFEKIEEKNWLGIKLLQCENTHSDKILKLMSKINENVIGIFNEGESTKVFAKGEENFLKKVNNAKEKLEMKGGGKDLIRLGFNKKEDFYKIKSILEDLIF